MKFPPSRLACQLIWSLWSSCAGNRIVEISWVCYPCHMQKIPSSSRHPSTLALIFFPVPLLQSSLLNYRCISWLLFSIFRPVVDLFSFLFKKKSFFNEGRELHISVGIKHASCPTRELLVSTEIKYHYCTTGESLLDQALLWFPGFTAG